MRWTRKTAVANEYLTAIVDERKHWRDVEYLALDFEATGLDLKRDDVISLGSVPIRDGRIVVGEQRYTLVRPTQPVPPESSKFHIIRNQDLADALTAGEAAELLLTSLRGRALLAHASWVEAAFLRRLFRLHGVELQTPIIDTAALARALGMRPRINTHEPHLETLADELGVPVHDPHHALGDAFTTAQVFLVLANRLEVGRSGPLTLMDLVQLGREYALLRP